MSVDVPGGVASAAAIAARSEPRPALARLVTTIKCENAGRGRDVPAAWTAAGRARLAAAGLSTARLAAAGLSTAQLAAAGLFPAGLFTAGPATAGPARAADMQVTEQAAAAAARIRRLEPEVPKSRRQNFGRVAKANIACLLPWPTD
jgi:hypothetical protein